MKRVFTVVAALFTIWYPASGETPAPNLKVYPPKAFSGNYISSPQNVGIIQSKKGLMYFANSSGVLEFDGHYWRMIKGTGSLGPRCFTQDSDGTIYVGGKDNLGYLAPDTSGELSFQSLLNLLKESDKGFGTIYDVFGTGDEIYFLTRQQLMRYKDHGIKIWLAESKFLGGYIVDDKLYLVQENIGLMKLISDEIRLVLPASAEPDDLSVVSYFKSLCPCNKATEHLIGKDGRNNYFLFNGNENLVKINSRVSTFLNVQRGIEKTAKTSDGKTAISTLSGGVIVIDKNGEFAELIDKHDGVPDNIVNALYIDAADGLWIAHDVGISRTQLNSPLSFIDQRSGYTGIIVSITRFEGKLYISTTDGVYVEKMTGSFDSPVSFERIPDIEYQAFTLLETNNTLLAATILGIFQIKGSHAKKIADGIATDLFPSGIKEQLVFAGINDSIVPLEFINGQWKAGSPIPGINDIIYKGVAGRNDIIWASNFIDKLYKIDFSGLDTANPMILTLDSSHGLTPGWVEPFLLDNEIYFGTSRGVFQFDENKKILTHTSDGRFQYFNERNLESGPIRTDRHGNVWVVSNGKAGKIFRNADGIYQWDSTGTMGIPETNIWSIFADENNIIWLGTTDLLVRYSTKAARGNIGNFTTYIRKVTLDDDSVIFMGAGDYSIAVPEFTFKHNDISFEYSSPFFEGENIYSVKLEGNDEHWSAWSTETKIRYTNLSPSNYIFKTKAKNIYGLTGSEAVYSFTVLRPFYLTIWAFLAYASLLGLTIWGIVVWNLRRLVRAKKRLEKIVKERTAELSSTNEELRKAKEFEEQFLANMSHEIRTPMNSVVGLTNLMMKSDLQPRQIKYLKAIRQSADNMLVIINDILDISKIQLGKLEIDAVDFSIREVVGAVLNVMKLQVQEKKLSIQVKIQTGVPDYVVGDAVRLNEIILNLVNNAVKFTDHGCITISCKAIEKNDVSVRLEFSVADTGMGIAPEKQDKLFNHFEQGGREIARKFGGSGLGLSICKQLVELQKGKIWVQSKTGEGTVFFFDILYGISHQTPVSKTRKSVSADIHLENLNILLVENNAFNQMVAKDTLEASIKNVKVDLANNGREAVSLVSKNNYDLVLMDLVMPVMDGYEAAKKIRKDLPPPKNKIKIMAMSASTTKQEKEECKAAGMNEYLPKPFCQEELILKIAGLIEQAETKGTTKNNFTNLDLLETIAGSDEIKKVKYVKMYLQGVPVLLTMLKKGIEDSNWNDIRESSHSLIPMFQYVGALSLKKLAQEIEQKAKSKEKLDEIAHQGKELETAIGHSYTELNNFLKTASANTEIKEG